MQDERRKFLESRAAAMYVCVRVCKLIDGLYLFKELSVAKRKGIQAIKISAVAGNKRSGENCPFLLIIFISKGHLSRRDAIFAFVLRVGKRSCKWHATVRCRFYRVRTFESSKDVDDMSAMLLHFTGTARLTRG